MPPLVEVIARAFAGVDAPFPEGAIFGTTDPRTIAREVDGFCRANLGSSVSECVFLESGQSSVFGLVLADGRRVALRAHSPSQPPGLLNAVHRVQSHLAEMRFPCPAPVLAPARMGRSYARAEELVEEGVDADAHRPEIRRAMAESLLELIERTRHLRGVSALQRTMLTRIPTGRLWPEPHHPMFDFTRKAEGARWIDDIARTARASLADPAGEMVIGHGDWAVKDFRFQGVRPRVIYDWESLALDRETILVGEAARGFTMTWRIDVPPAPRPEEAHAFVEDYVGARGRPFTRAERSTLAAAAVYAAAYTARCEYAVDRERDSYPPGSFLRLLADDGRQLMDLLS